MKNVAIIFGTRPEAIKLAPLVQLFRNHSEFRANFICSGQHKELLNGILNIWNIKIDIDLKENESNRYSNFADYYSNFLPLLKNEKFDLVIVHGDTFTAAAAALAAHHLQIPVAHVEAGLRSFDLKNPWPEESNRRIIDAISSLHFAPTSLAYENLISEGFEKTTYITGNTIVDALMKVSDLLVDDKSTLFEIEELLGFELSTKFILFTQHRRESFGPNQESVFEAVRKIAEAGTKIVFPVHPNPNVANLAKHYFEKAPNVCLIPPQGYKQFVTLLKFCALVITDSGGIQEEAPTFKKRVLITRLVTERPEVVRSGYGKLVGFDTNSIVEEALSSLRNLDYDVEQNPFGDGHAAERIYKLVSSFLENKE